MIPFFKARLAARLGDESRELIRAESGPTVILVCGVNGSGKTTSIAKLTGWFHDRGEKVILAAGDTFRAAAVEQLTIWSKRIGVEIVKQATGADPAAVAYDAAEAALHRHADVLIVDTAGRLHTQKNLMEELGKIRRVIGKCIPGAPHETLLVLDGTTGQNAVQQARLFHEISPVTGIFLTKLDGTARGGAVLSIHDELGLPVKFGQPENSLSIRAADADRPLTGANRELLAVHEEVILRHLAHLESANLLERVRVAIVEELPSGRVTEEQVADALNMSRRTLHRRLREYSTTFRGMLGQVRQELARRYIREERYSVTEVAFSLGYADTSAFSRAFRGWFGISPTEARQRSRAAH